jgi:hypothetical protein
MKMGPLPVIDPVSDTPWLLPPVPPWHPIKATVPLVRGVQGTDIRTPTAPDTVDELVPERLMEPLVLIGVLALLLLIAMP